MRNDVLQIEIGRWRQRRRRPWPPRRERTPNHRGYCAGDCGRTLVTRVGRLELRVLQDRQGRFRSKVFERYLCTEKAGRSADRSVCARSVLAQGEGHQTHLETCTRR
ncbi:MAG: transposase [Acidobacteriia bacterium]|nr:transposase [Terriglobia bacterium]